MVKEQVIPQLLVLDSDREKLAKRIKSVELDLRHELLEKQKIAFCELFLYLCDEYFKLRKHDVHSLLEESRESNEELLILESEVFKRAERSYKLVKYIGIPILSIIPVFGWVIIASAIEAINCNRFYSYNVDGFQTLRYCKLRRILIEKYGKDFFPFEMLQKALLS